MKLVLIILFLAFASCGENNKPGPVEIHYGQDICERCKMIISEEKFSSQIIADKRKVYNFDDIGGMIHYMSENKIAPGSVEIYVKDFNTGEWLFFDKAVYVVTDEIQTPMNYGIIAFADKKSADGFISIHRGKVIEQFTFVMEYVVNNA